MKLVANLKLIPDAAQARALRGTLERCNAACDWLAGIAWDSKTFGQYALHKLAYADVRTKFGLTAQAAVRCIAKVADAYKLDKKTQRHFRKHAAQPYDDRIIRFTKGNAVSIWTIDGRMVIPFVCGEHQRRLIADRKGEVDLMLVRGRFYLAVVCDIDELDLIKITKVLGVDFGIVNIAVDSDGTTYSGAAIEKVRSKLARRKAGLQKRGTKAAKRRLRKLSGQEARFRKHTNHVISKAIVSTAERTECGIGIEELTHIRKRVTARRSQRSRLHSWSFHQLRSFVAYKAQRAGVPIVAVDPRYTSQGCSCCGVIDKRNRPDQATFSCIACGHTQQADLNAARNISLRATAVLVTPPVVLAA
jgi:IS605 OrfB family transposase